MKKSVTIELRDGKYHIVREIEGGKQETVTDSYARAGMVVMSWLHEGERNEE